LDEIENSRRALIASRYRVEYPELGESEIIHLADLLSSARIRLIAETALGLLPEDEMDRLLRRFEIKR